MARTRGNLTRHPGDMTGFPTKMQPSNTAHKKAHKGLVHWEDPEGSWRGRWEGGSGWGTHVTPWLIHVNV